MCNLPQSDIAGRSGWIWRRKDAGRDSQLPVSYMRRRNGMEWWKVSKSKREERSLVDAQQLEEGKLIVSNGTIG